MNELNYAAENRDEETVDMDDLSKDEDTDIESETDKEPDSTLGEESDIEEESDKEPDSELEDTE